MRQSTFAPKTVATPGSAGIASLRALFRAMPLALFVAGATSALRSATRR